MPKKPKPKKPKIVHKTLPAYCPGCGCLFPGRPVMSRDGAVTGVIPPSFVRGVQNSTTNVDRQPMGELDKNGGVTTWDCFCPRCGWSGDIRPDR